MNIQRLLLAAPLAFALALGVVAGLRLSSEALAVMVGVSAGVAASIPTSVIVAWLTLRGHAADGRDKGQPRRDDQPHVIVLSAPPAATQNLAGPSAWPPTAPMPAERRTAREFTIIGGADDSSVE